MNSEDKLTPKEFWSDYWQRKNVTIVKKNNLFSGLFNSIFKSNVVNSFFEIGGFPGKYSIYVKKYFNPETVRFLDYYIDESIFYDFLSINGLGKKEVEFIHADFFGAKQIDKYDLVFSNGFVEHFKDTADVLKRHTDYLNEKGTLFVILPNFKGFNGWIQKTFDRENYRIHYIECMDIEYLTKICNSLKLNDIKVKYYGTYSIWLENLESKGPLFKIIFKSVWFLGKVISKVVQVESKQFSPYIYIMAQK